MADVLVTQKPVVPIDASTQFVATKEINGTREVVQIDADDLRGLDGVSAIATITNPNPAPIPAVGQTVQYAVDGSAGLDLNQIVAVGGSSTLKVVGTPTPTSIALENIDATPGATLTGARIFPIAKGSKIHHVTAAPGATLGSVGDTAFRNDGRVYEKTADTVWAERLDLLTQSEADARYPLKTDADPYPVYLTQSEAAALFSPIGGDAQGGLRYNLSLTTTFPAASGQVRLNNAATASATQISISESDRNGAAQSEVLDVLGIGTRIQIVQEDNEEIYAWFRVSGAVVYNGGDRTIPIAVVSVSGTFTAGEISISFFQILGTSSSGGASGIQFSYNDADPPTSTGQIRTPQASLSVATSVAINAADSNGDSTVDITARLKTGAIFTIAKDAATHVRFEATADYVSGSVAVVVRAEQGAIATGDTVFLAIASDALSSSSGSALTWQTTTSATSLAVNNGYFLNSNALEHELPTGSLGDPIEVIGVDGYSLKTQSGLVYLSNNTSNTGIKNAAGFPRATAILRCLGGANWMAMQSEGLELYAYSTSGPGASITENYRVAMLAAGYTMSAGEITALSNYINALNTAGVWNTAATTFGLYPLLGTTKVAQQINAVTPGAGDLATLDGTLSYNANGFTGNGSIYAGSTFMGTHWTSTNFRGMFGAFSGLISGTASPIWGLEGLSNSYAFGANEVVLQLHANSAANAETITFPFSGILGALSIASSSNVLDQGYINGGRSNNSLALARTSIADLRMLRCNSVNPPSGLTCKGFMCIKSAAGLSNADASSINSAFAAFLTAIGR